MYTYDAIIPMDGSQVGLSALYLYSRDNFFFFFFLNLSYQGAAIPLPVVHGYKNIADNFGISVSSARVGF